MTVVRAPDRGRGPAPPVEFPGTERFAIVRRLGRGGFGDVYEADDRELGTSVALKVLRRTSVRDLQSFKREFRALADVRHPNLVRLFELHCEGETWFFTMELVRGKSLRSEVWHHEPAPIAAGSSRPRRVHVDRARVESAFGQLVDAVAFLHGTGRLHRDLKPSNLLVDDHGRLVLLDFGLVTMIEHAAAGFAGTLGYVAPELVAGARASPASDWFSIGVVLHELVAGYKPPSGPVEIELGPPPILVVNADEVADLAAAARELCETRRPEVLVEALGVWSSASASVPASRPPMLLGRAPQLALLERAYIDAIAGTGRVVLLHGPSGIGKSHLLGHFLAGLDATVLVGACHERERIPFRAFDGVVDALAGHLAGGWGRAVITHDQAQAASRVFASLSAVLIDPKCPGEAAAARVEDPRELRRLAFAALRSLVAAIATHSPVVIAIDDLQWGDHDSAQLFAELAEPPLPRVLYVLGARGDDAAVLPDWWDQLVRGNRDLLQIAVPPLSAREIAELVRAHAGTREVTDEALHRIATESQGNPYFVHQLATRALRAQGAPPRVPTLQELVTDDIVELTPEARSLAESLALVARPVRRALALELAPDPPSARGALAELQHCQLVTILEDGRGDIVSLRHDRVREAVIAAIPAHRWRERNAHAARVLAQHSSDAAEPGLLSELYFEAGELGLASPHAERAADRAAQAFAFHQAAELYERAVEWCTDPARRERLRPRLADALASAGRGASAAPLYLDLAAGRSDLDALALRREAMEAYLTCGQLEAGLRVLRELSRALELPLPSSPGRGLAAALALLAKLRLRGTRVAAGRRPTAREELQMDTCFAAARGLVRSSPLRGAYLALRALELALTTGDRDRAVRYRSFVGAALYFVGGERLGRWAKTMLAEAARELERSADPILAATHLVCTGQVALLEADWAEALRTSDVARESSRVGGRDLAWETTLGELGAIHALEELGRLSDASARLDRVLRVALERGDVYGEVTARLHRALHRLAAGDIAGARVDADLARGMWTHHGFQVQHLHALRVHVSADLYEGLVDRAWLRVESDAGRIEGSLLLRTPSGRIDVTLMRGRAAVAMAAREPRDRRRLLEIVDRSADLLAREPRPDVGAHALMLRAAAADVRGDRAAALGLVTTAQARFTALGMRLCAAYAGHRRGQLEGHDGAARTAAAAALMQAEGIASPAAWAEVHAPGLGDRPS